MTFRKSLFFISIVLYYALIFPVHSFSATGSDNYSLKFDGGDRVVIPDSPSLNPSQITVETWVYLNRLAPVGSWDNQFLTSKGNDQTQGSYYLSANRDQFHFYLGTNGVDQVHAATPSMVKTNRWYHVAGTYDGVNIKIYVNGVLQGTTPASITIGNTGILSLGYHDLPGSEYYLDGNLDDVRIWNVARTQSEIQADMLRTLTGSEPGLAGYWPMDEGSGQIVGDASENGNNGQIGSTAGEDADDPAWRLRSEFNSLSFGQSISEVISRIGELDIYSFSAVA